MLFGRKDFNGTIPPWSIALNDAFSSIPAAAVAATKSKTGGAMSARF
jgi:hypothetical protein